MIRDRILTGKIVSGIQQGAFFMQLDWVQEQCLAKLGFKPYPGTLNLEITANSTTIATALAAQDAIELVPPDSSFCSGHVIPATIAGTYGAIIVPAEKVRVHGKNILEVISQLYLKDALNLADGDWLTVTVGGALPDKPS